MAANVCVYDSTGKLISGTPPVMTRVTRCPECGCTHLDEHYDYDWEYGETYSTLICTDCGIHMDMYNVTYPGETP